MLRKGIRYRWGVLLLVVFASGCSWVKLTPEGESVAAVTMDDVTNCKKVGVTNVSLRHKVAGIERKKKKVAKELEILARNSAVELGGDTVVPESEITEGKQAFQVYKCREE